MTESPSIKGKMPKQRGKREDMEKFSTPDQPPIKGKSWGGYRTGGAYG